MARYSFSLVIVKNVLMLSFILVILFILFSCDKNSHIFYVDKQNNGVLIVKNNEIPMFAPEEKSVQIKFLFKIGVEDGDENYVFGSASFIGVDQENNIYVLDMTNCRVMVYNCTGHFLRSFGNKGRGPGEFLTPHPGAINHDTLVVYDFQNSRYQILDRFGKHLNSIPKEQLSVVSRLRLLNDGTLLALEYFPGLMKTEIQMFCYNLSGKTVAQFFQHSVNSNMFWAEWLPRFSLAVDSEEFIFLPADEKTAYEIQVFDRSGKLRRKITRKSEKFPYTADEIQKKQEAAKRRKELTGLELIVPTQRPTILDFSVDAEDRLWVRTGNYNLEEGWTAFDIFDKEGRYLYQYISREIRGPIQFIGNRIYESISFNDDYPRLEVYQIQDNL